MRLTALQWRKAKALYSKQVLIPLSATAALALFIGLFFGLATRSRMPTSLRVSCDTNSNVRIKYDSIINFDAREEYWNANFFLGITLGFGRFSFSTVRIIDGLWDVVVARCGQALLALLAYPVLRRSLIVQMQRSSASLPLFASIAFDKVSIISAWRTACDAVTTVRGGSTSSSLERKLPSAQSNANKRRVWRYLGWLSVLTYLLAFPTMTSITTGYQPRYEPYLTPPNTDILIPMSPFKIPGVVVVNGSDIGRPGVTPLDFTDSDPTMRNLARYYDTCYRPVGNVYRELPNTTYPRVENCPEDACNCTIAVAPPLYEGSLFTQLEITSSNITLDGKIWTFDGGLSFTRQCGGEGVNTDCLDVQGIVYLTDGNYTLKSSYMQDHGFCRPLNDFQWGFSSLALLTHLLITLTVAFILTTLHFDALRKGQSHGYDGNLYSDAVLVSRELESLGFDRPLEKVPAPELKQMVKAKQAQAQMHDDSLLRLRHGTALSEPGTESTEYEHVPLDASKSGVV